MTSLAVAEEVGLDPIEVERGIAGEDIKAKLSSATGAAIAAGVVGVPAVLVSDQSFWGDGQLEAAAAAITV